MAGIAAADQAYTTGDPMRAARLFLCLPLLAAASGCGWIFTHGPPTGHEQLEYIPCTESDAGPHLERRDAFQPHVHVVVVERRDRVGEQRRTRESARSRLRRHCRQQQQRGGDGDDSRHAALTCDHPSLGEHMRLALVAPVVLLTTPLLAQQREVGTLGLNLRVDGGATVGVTWRASRAVTLRPAVSFAWNKTETPLSTSETTQYTVNLDLLLRTASWNRLTSYIGAGGGVGNISGSGGLVGKTWAARALAGA